MQYAIDFAGLAEKTVTKQTRLPKIILRIGITHRKTVNKKNQLRQDNRWKTLRQQQQRKRSKYT